jgi:hypothetical protein
MINQKTIGSFMKTVGSFIPVILKKSNTRFLYTIMVLEKFEMSYSWPEMHHLFHENRRFFKGFEIRGTDSCLIPIFFFP